MKTLSSIAALAFLLSCACPSTQAQNDQSQRNNNVPPRKYDIVIYGGTSAAVTAAVEAKRKGKTVAIVCPDTHLGGLSSGGLGWTDTGNKAVIGGLAREFYHRVWKKYQQDDNWRWQKKEEYGGKGQGTRAIDGKQRTMWIFEPHIAESVFEDFVKEFKIPVFRKSFLDRENGVEIQSGRIKSIRTLDGKSFTGKIFFDATYEGDLLAAAGCKFHVGREANSVYDETFNGIQTGVLHHRHHFGVLKTKISPYRIENDPTSGLLPKISSDPPGEYGAGDHRVQAYCFRMCLTQVAENRTPFSRPKNYDSKDYELLARIYKAGWRETFNKYDPIPNLKTDTNNHGPFSTDNIGMNYDYPTASYSRRREIIQEHRDYQMGWLYFVSHDPSVPESIRKKMQQWGLAKDEFQDNGNWPHQIYVREARRLIGEFVMTENELLKRQKTPNSVGMGSYTMDSHNVRRYVTPEGYVQNEGDIGVSTQGPYKIAYGSLVPKKKQCENLMVPVCVSSSHIAFGSIRMEPVFMILGHSAATAACIAIDDKVAVQDVSYEKLRKQLETDGQVLDYEYKGTKANGGKSIKLSSLKGIVVDDAHASFQGEWTQSSSTGSWVGRGYQHDGDKQDGKSTATFQPKKFAAGKYEVRLAYSTNSNRSSKVLVKVTHAEGESQLRINQRKSPTQGGFVVLGTFTISKDSAKVIVSNEGSDGYVIADAVQWLPISKSEKAK